MSVWPTDLPAPALSSFTESPPENTIRSSMDRGPAKLRRRTTANVRPVGFSLMLTKEQVASLDNFYNVTTYGGVDEFDFEHPRTLELVSARFTQPPQYAEHEGVVYSVNVALEIMP